MSTQANYLDARHRFIDPPGDSASVRLAERLQAIPEMYEIETRSDPAELRTLLGGR